MRKLYKQRTSNTNSTRRLRTLDRPGAMLALYKPEKVLGPIFDYVIGSRGVEMNQFCNHCFFNPGFGFATRGLLIETPKPQPSTQTVTP